MADRVRERVAAAVRKHGTAKVAREFELSREAILAYAGDFPRQSGTDALIEQRAERLGFRIGD